MERYKTEEQKERHRRQAKEDYYKNRDTRNTRKSTRRLEKIYGLSPNGWQEMFDAQEGRCAICGVHQSEMKYRFCVDHDHETGQVRSLLCSRCNPGIGNFKDRPDLLRKAAEYIEKHMR